MGSTKKEKSPAKTTESAEKNLRKKKEKKEKKEKANPVESKPIEDKEEEKPKEEPKIEKTNDDDNAQGDAAVTKKSKKRKARKTSEEGQSKKKVVNKSSDPVTYLRLFQSDRSAWKFNKIHQTWLLKHVYDADQIEDDDFPILVEYLKGLQGGARDRTLKEAQGKIPAKTTDYDQEIFDAEAALAFVATPAVSSAVSDDEDENDTVEIKRARSIVRALT